MSKRAMNASSSIFKNSYRLENNENNDNNEYQHCRINNNHTSTYDTRTFAWNNVKRRLFHSVCFKPHAARIQTCYKMICPDVFCLRSVFKYILNKWELNQFLWIHFILKCTVPLFFYHKMNTLYGYQKNIIMLSLPRIAVHIWLNISYGSRCLF